jgi:hypothetical protein
MGRLKTENPTAPYPDTKMGDVLREQAREVAKKQDGKEAEFGLGGKRQGDGK